MMPPIGACPHLHFGGDMMYPNWGLSPFAFGDLMALKVDSNAEL